LAHGQVWLDVAAGVLPFGQFDVPVGEWLVRDLAEQVADDVEPGVAAGGRSARWSSAAQDDALTLRAEQHGAELRLLRTFGVEV
jgi:hypothetical protein